MPALIISSVQGIIKILAKYLAIKLNALIESHLVDALFVQRFSLPCRSRRSHKSQ